MRESYSFPVRDLIYSEMIDRYGEEHDSVDRVVTLAGFEKPDAFYEYMQGHGIPFVKASEDLSSSLIRINKEGEIEGCMLISRLQDGDIDVYTFKFKPGKRSRSHVLQGGLKELFGKARK